MQCKETFQKFKLEKIFDSNQTDLPENEQSNIKEEEARLTQKSLRLLNRRLVSPLNELSPCQTQRRTDDLFSALREEVLKQHIKTTHIFCTGRY